MYGMRAEEKGKNVTMLEGFGRTVTLECDRSFMVQLIYRRWLIEAMEWKASDSHARSNVKRGNAAEGAIAARVGVSKMRKGMVKMAGLTTDRYPDRDGIRSVKKKY